MRFTDFLGIITSRWRVIALSVLLAMGAAWLLTARTAPVYTAQARVFLSAEPKQGKADGTVLLSSSDLETFQSILATPAVLDPIRRDLALAPGHPIDVEATISSTTIVDITARSSDPQEAADIANAVGPHLAAVGGRFAVVVSSAGYEVVSTPLEEATPPSSPTSPNLRRSLLLALLGGLALGVGIALVRHSFDTRVRTEEDIRRLSDAPVLTGLPAERRRSRQGLLSIEDDPHGQHAEAIRRLRTNLLFVDVTTDRHSFVITSAVPGEGKTTTAVNLALAMADAGTKTLLVDADLRRPAVAQLLGMEGGVGLTTVLLGQASASEVIQQWGVSRVHVLPAGQIPPNPSELLGSQPMRDLFASLVEEYEFVIVDSPPVVPVIDAVVVQELTGGVVMVVGHDRTRKRDLASAIKQLATVEAPVAGFVNNFVPGRAGSVYRYGYRRGPDGGASAEAPARPVRPAADDIAPRAHDGASEAR